MRYTVVTPWIYPPYMEACAATCKFDDANWLRVDNTGFNWGVDRAVNWGIDKMYADDTDWLIYMSATMRFGDPGGLDFLDHLEQNPDYKVIEAYGYTEQSIWGWHLIAFNRSMIDVVGRWDENFSPAYFDDLDYSLRFQHAYDRDFYADGGPDPAVWAKLQIQAEDAGAAHALHKVGLSINPLNSIYYFQQKWGRHPDHSWEKSFRHPWNDPTHPVSYWPPVELNGITGYCDRPLPPYPPS